MKVLHVFLIFSILSLSTIFAEEKPNLDDPKVQDQIIAIAVQKLDRREKVNGDRISYLPFRQVPYTGWYVGFHENGQVSFLTQYKDGKVHGLYTSWHENGEKEAEENTKDGKAHGLSTSWYVSGQKKNEITYKEGKRMSAETWKPDGEKCPVTNLKDGNGVWVVYDEDGTEISYTYKDGELVLD